MFASRTNASRVPFAARGVGRVFVTPDLVDESADADKFKSHTFGTFKKS
jgi:hypothetical protein